MKEMSLGTRKLLINGALGLFAIYNGIMNSIDGYSKRADSIVYIAIALCVWQFASAKKDDEMYRMHELKAKASLVNKLWIFAFVMCFLGNKYNMIDFLVAYILIFESIEFRRLEKYGD